MHAPDDDRDHPLRRGLMRLRHARRSGDTAGSEARVEVLADRIELLEYTLNEYIDKIDAVATHSTRISVDRLIPAVERLGALIAHNREGHAAEARAAEGDETGMSAAPSALECRQDEQDVLNDALANILARFSQLETRIAGLPDRIRIAAAPHLPAPDGGARAQSHILAALSVLARQQDSLKDHVDTCHDAIHDLASARQMEEMSARILQCEQHLARIPDIIRLAASEARPDMRAISGPVDRLHDSIEAFTQQQAAAQDGILARLATVEARLNSDDLAPVLTRLDELDTRIAEFPDRLKLATAPPALAETDADRGAMGRIFAALSALSRQQEQLSTRLAERLEALELRASEGPDIPIEDTARAIAETLIPLLRDAAPRPTLPDTTALVRTTQHRDRKMTVALARIERVLAAMASREPAEAGLLKQVTCDEEDRSARILDAIARLRREMSEAFAASEAAGSMSQSAVNAALAELLAVAQRDSTRRDA